MKRDFITYSVLLVVGLALAFYVSMPDKDKGDSSKLEWVKVDPSGVSGLRFESATTNIQIKRREDGEGFWGIVTVKPKKDKDGDDKNVEGKGKPAFTREFKISKRIDDVLSAFNPLYVLRNIGEIKEDQKEEFGLHKQDKKFKILLGGDPVVEFIIGKRAYGSRNLFVLDAKTNNVLLINGSNISDIEKAEVRMFERSLFSVSFNDLNAAEIKTALKQKRVEHTKRDGSGKLQWHDPGEDGAIKASYSSWLNKFNNLRVQRMINADEKVEIAKNGKEVLQIVLFKSSDPVVTLKIIKQPGEKPSYWVDSSFLGSFAKVDDNRMDSIVKDLDNILSD